MTSISGHTKYFAVLGHPIGHTLSPVMHNASIKALGLDAVYLAFDVSPEDLMTALSGLTTLGFAGVNLTVPLKEVAFRELSELDESARLLGAVNTVRFADGRMTGYNTDGYGFLKAIEDAFGQGIKGSNVFVLGAGGAGRAVALVCAREGARQIVLSDIDSRRTAAVKAEVAAISGETEVLIPTDSSGQSDLARQADLIVQATPVGMKEEDTPLLPAEAFRPGQRVLDLIYMYPKTGLMKNAETAGALTVNGLGMLLHQGARAFSIWTGLDPDTGAMRAALEERVYG
ncbi:MAG: shikimate dehydrogenase [Verrucomicrobia bacterium]|nr:shikimate dehydrogenase [Verrucomicrobiota bacterium]